MADDDDYNDDLPISDAAYKVWSKIQTLLTYGITYQAGVVAHRAGAKEVSGEHILLALEKNFQGMIEDLKENGDTQSQLAWLEELIEPPYPG